MEAKSPVDLAGDHMLAGVALHPGKTGIPIQHAVHLSAHFQGRIADMEDSIPFLPGVQHRHAVQRAGIAGLTAAFGIESGGVQRHGPVLFPCFAAGDDGGEPGQKAILIK